ncbi:MAG: sodium-dependent transporter [Hyphomonadaceae bacterium]
MAITPSGEGATTPQWTSRFAFLMAAIGSAVGLGNLWRFPFMTGQYGGSAFVIVYLICVVLVAYPIMMSELALGRHKGLSAIESISELAKDAGKSKNWGVVGIIGVICSGLVLSTYSPVAGQVMAYATMSYMGEFAGRAASEAATVAPLYNGALPAILWHTLFMVMTIAIVAQGLHGGIERIVTILMPIFFFLLAGVAIYALVTGAGAKAVDYLFTPRFDEITTSSVLAALGQAFFSLSLGSAIMITYGSFLSREESIPANAAVIAGSDTLVAIIAGLMIFPVVFAFGLDPAAGMGLIFNALPAVFSGMPAGSFIGGTFFVLAFVAAITSAISLLIVPAVALENYTSLSKTASAIVVGIIVWAVGALSILVKDTGGWLDFFSGSVLLPLGGLLVAILAGWVAPSAAMRAELPHASDRMFAFWRFVVRYPAPLAVGVILILGLDDKFGWGVNAWINSLTG